MPIGVRIQSTKPLHNSCAGRQSCILNVQLAVHINNCTSGLQRDSMFCLVQDRRVLYCQESSTSLSPLIFCFILFVYYFPFNSQFSVIILFLPSLQCSATSRDADGLFSCPLSSTRIEHPLLIGRAPSISIFSLPSLCTCCRLVSNIFQGSQRKMKPRINRRMDCLSLSLSPLSLSLSLSIWSRVAPVRSN